MLLDVEYLPATDGDETPASSGAEDSAGLTLIRKSTCFTCHADKASLVGPSFVAIAGKYAHDPQAIDRLERRVREGCRWIYLGFDGIVRIVEKPDDTIRGRYRLTASYLDNGVAGMPGTGKRGEDSITFHIK